MPVITQRRWVPLHWIHAAVLGALSVGAASADNSVSTALAAQSTQQSPQDTLLQAVRASTERFKDVSVAESEGYHLLFGCVTGPDSGAMGLHYVNMQLVQSGIVDATRGTGRTPVRVLRN
jgi:hypothetical protein